MPLVTVKQPGAGAEQSHRLTGGQKEVAFPHGPDIAVGLGQLFEDDASMCAVW